MVSLLVYLKSIFLNQIVKGFVFSTLILSSVIACSISGDEPTEQDPIKELQEIPNDQEMSDDQAAVIGVNVTGSEQSYTFNVTIESPDTGCDQYADWWEVFTADGDLIYRRILGHSHVDEQPFTRSGGIVAIDADDFIYVRAHQNNLGYGSLVYSGTINSGMVADTLDPNFADELLTEAPLPTDCAY